MKKQQQIAAEDAKILVQSQPLSAALWYASTTDLEAISERLPDPAYVDSFSWADYSQKLHSEPQKKADTVDFIKAVPLADQKSEIINQEQEAVMVSEVNPQSGADQAQKAETKLENDTRLQKEDVPYSSLENKEEVEEPVKIIRPVQTVQKSKKPSRSRSIERNEIKENSNMNTPHSEIVEMDFYQWLESLQTVDKNQTKTKTAKTSKSQSGRHPSNAELETKKVIASSVELGDEIVSETLAKLLARQGHKSEALEMYQKLIQKYPEKHSTFATAIEKLKT